MKKSHYTKEEILKMLESIDDFQHDFTMYKIKAAFIVNGAAAAAIVAYYAQTEIKLGLSLMFFAIGCVLAIMSSNAGSRREIYKYIAYMHDLDVLHGEEEYSLEKKKALFVQSNTGHSMMNIFQVLSLFCFLIGGIVTYLNV